MSGPTLDELRRRVPGEIVETLEQAARLGFLGPVATSGQIDHSLGFAIAAAAAGAAPPEAFLDLGSGGGLPGLVLAACWPTSRTVLVEASKRRCSFLRQAVARSSRPGEIEVCQGRAEDLGHEKGLRGRFEFVTARSFGLPAVTAECGSPFLAPGGLLVVSEPPPDSRKDRWPEPGLAPLGLEVLSLAEVEGRFGFQVLRKLTPTPDRFPRRTGVPMKRPLF